MNRYRSKYEATTAQKLTKAGIAFGYETVTLRYRLENNYRPDFIVGRTLIETKGRWLPEDRRKILAVLRQNPGIDLRMVFQSPHRRLSKAPKSLSYGAWCDQHGIKWAGPEIPSEWLV